LLSCLLKTFERLVYRRLQWTIESQFILPEFQSGFRSSRSCTDNLITLTARIHFAFLRRASILTIFLDVESAFDNVIPNILIKDLQDIGFPAQICKFIENLLSEHNIYYIRNGDLLGPLTTHKALQDSILSPFLFNIYLRNIGRFFYNDAQILQYAVLCRRSGLGLGLVGRREPILFINKSSLYFVSLTYTLLRDTTPFA